MLEFEENTPDYGQSGVSYNVLVVVSGIFTS